MSLADIQNPTSIRQAMAEFNRIGREAFLAKYGFKAAKSYYINEGGKRYDSKAIIGAAHGYEFPEQGPLRAEDFSGGEATVERKLKELGFAVVRQNASIDLPVYISDGLTPGNVYTREQLAVHFGITDSTINTGIFQPKTTKSIWLFVTEDKPPDRTQYKDFLDGDTLHWEGQKEGRKDPLIINHAKDGNELLVFYRRRKYEHPGAGFNYLGKFQYVSHQGSRPTSFVLVREQNVLDQLAAEIEETEPFDPTNLEDGRKRTLSAVVRRQGQKSFRDALLKAYGGRCCITGCDVEAVLEAAHIVPYMGKETNHVQNGLLLRADIHTLFDLGLIGVDPTDYSVVVSEKLKGTEYEGLAGKGLNLPLAVEQRPTKEVLSNRRV